MKRKKVVKKTMRSLTKKENELIEKHKKNKFQHYNLIVKKKRNPKKLLTIQLYADGTYTIFHKKKKIFEAITEVNYHFEWGKR